MVKFLKECSIQSKQEMLQSRHGIQLINNILNHKNLESAEKSLTIEQWFLPICF